MRWATFQTLRRNAARHAEHWTAAHGSVWTQDGSRVCIVGDRDLAELIAEQHNALLSLTNIIVELVKKLDDKSVMERLDHDD